MIELSLTVATRNGVHATFHFPSLGQPCRQVDNAITVELCAEMPYRIRTTPPAHDRIRTLSYRISTPLKNYHEVIVPDTGRTYSSSTQLIEFWGKEWKSRINNVRMPVFIFTGQDLNASLVFGVIGRNIETDFVCSEPATNRALIAWMKRLSLEIRRGTEEFPIPDSLANQTDDGAITEYLYIKEADLLKGRNWHKALRDFSQALADYLQTKPRTTAESLQPYWCSWTDWFSGDVTSEVILENVRAGLKLGISNYIIDDGWFGPGLDNDRDVKLNIGDWSEAKSRIPDLRKLVSEIHNEGAKAIIWCAPHAVSPDSKAFSKLSKYLVRIEKNKLVLTANLFHCLCFMCPQAREIMADICAELVRRYNVDGAKYDLFNAMPPEPCTSSDHQHDTTSQIEGLEKTLRLIEEKTRKIKNNYITELKQNYATPYLYKYGTVIRAGDTPYSTQGNFLRTAFISGYTPFSLNDYQTITNNDTVEEVAAIIIKMMAVGIPSYSMNILDLAESHRALIAFYHKWYMRNLDIGHGNRIPLDPELRSWLIKGHGKNIYFLLNNQGQLNVENTADCEILNGTFCKTITMLFSQATSVDIAFSNVDRPAYFTKSFEAVRSLVLEPNTGDIIALKFKDV